MASLLSWVGKEIKGGAQTVKRDVVQPVVQTAKKVVNQVNPVDNGRTFQQPTPTSSNSTIHQLTHNGATNVAGSLLNNFTGIPTAIDAARLGTAELTHNKPAIGNATISLNKNLNRFLPVSLAEGTVPFARSVAGAALSPYSEHVANQQSALAEKELSHAYAPFVGGKDMADANASAIKNDFYDTELNKAGLNQNDSLKTDIRKIGGQAGTTAANIIFASQMGNGLVRGTIKPPVKAKLTNQAVKFGTANAASNVAATAQEDSPNLKDYIKSGVAGFAVGAAGAGVGHIPVKAISETVGKEASKTTPTAVVHQGLIKTNPSYAALQDALDRSTAATNKINQNGGSKVALNQHLKNIDNIQTQMAQMRSKAKIAGGRNVLASIPAPEPLPENIPKGTESAGTSSNANIASSSKASIPAPQLPKALTSQELSIGRALGMNDADIASAKAASTAPPLTSIPKVMSVPKQAGAVERVPNSMKPVNPGLSAAENTAKNPIKVHIPEVAPGDYAKARSNAQLASNPIEYSAGQVAQSIGALNPAEKANFWHAVENPKLIKSPEMQTAVSRWNSLSNRVHATSQALGGNTGYLANYARHNWDLSDPAMAEKYNQLVAERGSRTIDPYNFSGLDTQERAFKTVFEGEAAGFKLKNAGNPAKDVLEYAGGSANALKKQALSKGIAEADMNEAEKNRSFDLGPGQNLSSLSKRAVGELKAYKQVDTPKAPLAAYRKINRGLKKTLLSASEFHPINISALKAGPAEALAGHPVLAAKGVYGTFRAQIGHAYSDKLQEAALKDGTVDAAARLGTPIKAGSDYSTSGKLAIGKSGIGEKTIFEKAMPAMHIRMVQGLVKDLQKRGISLDSPQARQAGLTINKTMGFINKEVSNLDPKEQRIISDLALAPQFTVAKWGILKDALTKPLGSVAGKYARSAVVGNTLAVSAIGAGLGYMLHQKSDNIKDTLVRDLIHPSIPTPFKDKKGNTIELGLPSTYASEALGLGANLQRNKNNHLSINVNPSNLPGNLANYGRSRLAVVPGDVLKLATNTDYAGKPLYDPNAPAGTKAQQVATTLLGDSAPIGAQGALQTKAVSKHLPNGVQQVLAASSPGSNPLLKSVASSFGLTPRTDKTVGKGLQTTQYYSALDKANSGLNAQEKAAMQMETGSKKNPVTGAYEVAPTSDDSRAKATALLQNPKVINHLITLNKTLGADGQSVDPLWSQTNAQITKYLQYQAMPPGGPDRTDWMTKNTAWYTPLAAARDTFFNSLPAGDPNKPKTPIAYPTASPAVASLQTQYDAITDPTTKSNFLDAHQDLIDQWNKQATYTNAMRTAQGYSALKSSPQAAPALQSFMNDYNAADKTTRATIRSTNPSEYQNMIAYYDSSDLNTINKQGAVDQLVGEPDQTSKQNKAISSLSQDIYQNPDGTYSIVPAGWMDGLSDSNGYGTSSTSGKAINPYLANLRYQIAIKPPKQPKAATIKATKAPKQVALKKFTPQKLAITKRKTPSTAIA